MRFKMLVPTVLTFAALTPAPAVAATQAFGGADVVPTFECFAPGGEQFAETGSAPSESYAVPFSGVITSWTFVAGPEVQSQIRLKVFRPTMLPTEFVTVGESAAVAPIANITSVFASSIPVQAGDLLGLRVASNMPTDCGVPTNGLDDLLHGSTGANPAVGSTATLPLPIPGVRLTIGATVETDVDGDGLGDDTQDSDDDGDGVADAADNCPVAANPGQENLDGDAQGDACDADRDGDGIPDAAETLAGTSPAAADTDGDGLRDGPDRCPLVAAATADGCPVAPPPVTVTTPPVTVATPPATVTTPPVTVATPPATVTTAAAPPPPAPALSFTVSGAPSSIKLATLRGTGLSVKVTPSVSASFLGELRATVKGASIAKAGDLLLAETSLKRAGGRRTLKLTVPSSQRDRLHTKAKLTLRIVATDATGRTKTITRSVTIT